MRQADTAKRPLFGRRLSLLERTADEEDEEDRTAMASISPNKAKAEDTKPKPREKNKVPCGTAGDKSLPLSALTFLSHPVLFRAFHSSPSCPCLLRDLSFLELFTVCSRSVRLRVLLALGF